jgi:hypothetical protein
MILTINGESLTINGENLVINSAFYVRFRYRKTG